MAMTAWMVEDLKYKYVFVPNSETSNGYNPNDTNCIFWESGHIQYCLKILIMY